ncbi:MAG: acyl-CoA thioesterase [Phycisphaerales bacterium]|nr:acyl-CoA thioesterase [Phycisphaerales bacterium]
MRNNSTLSLVNNPEKNSVPGTTQSVGGGGASAGSAASAASSGPTPKAATPVGGSTRVRVRYCECDSMGVAHHASYVPWLEIGRTELLRATGVSYRTLESHGVFLVIVKLDVRYRRPIRYDDVVEVRTRVVGGSRVKIEHEYELVVVERDGEAKEEAVAAAATTLACVDGEGRVRELPGWLVAEKAK